MTPRGLAVNAVVLFLRRRAWVQVPPHQAPDPRAAETWATGCRGSSRRFYLARFGHGLTLTQAVGLTAFRRVTTDPATLADLWSTVTSPEATCST